MHDIFARGWANFLARLDGPMHFRFVVQPLVAMILGARAAMRDARAGEPPFLWAILSQRQSRGDRVKSALLDLSSMLLVATVLDAAYQVGVHRSIFALELVLTVTVLALVPYVLVRGPLLRLVRRAHWAGGRTASR